MGEGKIGLQGERSAKARHRLGKASEFEQYVAEVAMAVGARWIKLNGAAKYGYGFATFAEVAQHIAEVIEGLEVAGVQSERPPIARDGRFPLSQRRQDKSQVVVRGA